ncbi:thioredoxin reductase 1, cytoplasmic-like [Sphaeramia orbicularis]|uniref:thioredoxin reductase 1, cytoplasmic-like n=1 Tax=Sphaeramia orbicularis TaxID=375764 RepID=UPI0011816CE2|nr:thioredoxin reductase 1, cytoplasmic-like [Sphaeramia orbicularis]
MDPPAGPSLGGFDFDLLVIGGGSGGLAVAKEAAGLRRKVLILDLAAPSTRGTQRELGGSTFNKDTIRKFLQQASLLGKAIQDSNKYGWRFIDDVSHGWSDLVEAVQGKVKARSLELKRELKSCGVFYLEARGEIVAPHTVEVTDINGRKQSLTAETLVIATGDRPYHLGIPGDKEHCLSSDDLLSLLHPPGRTLVVGGSAEGLECAGFLCGLGYPVTVMLQPDLLEGLDQKMAQKIENHMLVAGVDFICNCSLTKVEQKELSTEDRVAGISAAAPQQVSRGRLSVTVVSKEGQTKQDDFDTVLLTVGRKACTSGIGLERVGVQFNQDTGRILVNEKDQTSVDYIYAIGSVQHGRPSTTGLSVHAGTLLACRLYGGENTLCDYTNVPAVVLTPLEYAACGLSEEKANLMFGKDNIEVYHNYYWPLEWTLPARNKNSCYVKVICYIPENDRVVGLHIMGPNAGDVLQGFATAMKCGLTKRQLDATVGISPSSAQVLTSLTQTQRMSEASMLRGNC